MADPLAALLALRKSGVVLPNEDIVSQGVGEANPALASAPPTGNRNEATVMGLRHMLGIPGEDQGDVSQTDYQDAANTLIEEPAQAAEAQKLKQIEAQYEVPADIKGQYDLKAEAAKGANALGLESAKNQAINDRLSQFMAPSAGANGETTAPMRLSGINAQGEPSFAPQPKLDVNASRAITSFKEAQPMLDDLEKTLDTSGNQALSWLKNRGNAALYNQGFATTPQADLKTQLSGLVQVLGASPYVMGSRNYQLIQQAMKHLTSPGQSDQFMQQQINELRSLWPRMQNEVLAASRTPDAPLNQPVP